LQKKPIILRSLLIVATPYVLLHTHVHACVHFVERVCKSVCVFECVSARAHFDIACTNESCHILQHAATHCSILQHTAILLAWPVVMSRVTYCNTLQHAGVYYNTLQHTATHCNTLQHTATHCNTLQHTAYFGIFWHGVTPSMRDMTYSVCCSVLQCVAVCCSMLNICVLQYAVVSCSNWVSRS